MKANRKNLTYRLLHETSGQVFVWTIVAMICLLGVCGFVVDMGHAMVVNRQLQISTDAAALAGAQDIPNSNYSTIATSYGANTSTDKNYSNMDLSGVTTSVSGYCSATVEGWGINCVSVGGSNINALTVTQSVTVPTYFIRVLGIDSVTLTAKASAAWKGASRYPYNVAIIVDTTQSMQDVDGDSSNCGSSSRIYCSMEGVVTLLQNLSPCSPSATTCPTASHTWPTANVSGAEDEVALYAFPGLNSSTTAEDDAGCTARISSPGGTTSTSYYDWPNSSALSTIAAPPDANPDVYYQVVGFSSDYKTNDSATASLISDSYLVKAAGGGGDTCSYNTSSNGGVRGGIQDVGGAGTYYAAILYQAQYDLYQNYVTRLNDGTQTENVMILLSDGDASSSSTQIGNSSTANSNSGGSFPSYIDQCHQAVTAALTATNGTYPSATQETDSTTVPKTTVYSVAYGAEASGCDTASGGGNEGLEPCDTMREISSSYNWSPSTDQTFYSDYTSSGGSSTCISNSNSSTNINTIFTEIAANLSHARLIPTGQ
jgi:Flp pilus assembly protein TadG